MEIRNMIEQRIALTNVFQFKETPVEVRWSSLLLTYRPTEQQAGLVSYHLVPHSSAHGRAGTETRVFGILIQSSFDGL